ncbi:MAG: hypothetical protein K6E98_06555, partial [Lachnospiraceae bacterium]|nr:hypothetical protein [Lachnospiraceae bacterium]
LVVLVTFFSYPLLNRFLPIEKSKLKIPVLKSIEPSELVQGSKLPDEGKILIRGDNLSSVVRVFINGKYNRGIIDQELYEDIGRIKISLPSEYYSAPGQVSIQVESLDDNTGKLIKSNLINLDIISTEDLETPIIDKVTPESLNMANTDEQWVTINGSGLEKCYGTVNGIRKETLYNELEKSLKIKLDYSDWCLQDNALIRVGKVYNDCDTPVISNPYTMKVVKQEIKEGRDKSWTKEHYVALGMGEFDGMCATNSLEAFEMNYEIGQRVFEADIGFTSDGKLILLPGNKGGSDENNILNRSWKDISERSEYSVLTFEMLLNIMGKYPDIYIVTDTKDMNSQAINSVFREIVNTAKGYEKDIMDRLIVQVYDKAMYYQVMNIYPFKSVIYKVCDEYANVKKDKEILDFIKETGISAMTCSSNVLNKNLIYGLDNIQCPLYVEGVDDTKMIDDYASKGVYGFYSNRLGSHNCNVDIDKLRKEFLAEDSSSMHVDENKEILAKNYNDLINYLKALNNDNFIIALAVKGDICEGMTDEIREIFKDYGIEDISFSDKGSSFLAIVDSGECVLQEYNGVFITEEKWVNGVHFKIKSCGTAGEGEIPTLANVLVDGEETAKNQDGLNVVVYDKRLGKVIDSSCFDFDNDYQKYEEGKKEE